MTGQIVIGGPFAGKSTLLKLMRERYSEWPVLESDEQRKKSPQWRGSLWAAWQPSHPDHAEWQRLRQGFDTEARKFYEQGGIYITHDLPKWADPESAIMILPSQSELTARRAEYSAWVGSNTERGYPREPADRIKASVHYYAKPITKRLERTPGVITVRTSLSALNELVKRRVSADPANPSDWHKKVPRNAAVKAEEDQE